MASRETAPNTNAMNITIRNLFAFGSKIDKLNRRAKRLGLPEITYTVAGERQEELRNSSRHEGTKGERIEITGTIIRRFSFDTEFGTTHKIVLNAGGLCYISSEPKTFHPDGAKLDFVDEGHTIKFKGTIKGFSEFNGVKQIDLLRPSKAVFIEDDK